MITKEILLKSMDDLPGSFTIDELIDKLVFIEKVNKGLEQSYSGQTYTKAQAQEKLGKWLR
jgi:hypothetical protein